MVSGGSYEDGCFFSGPPKIARTKESGKMGYMYSWKTLEVIDAKILENELAAARRLESAHRAAIEIQRTEIQRTAAIALREREEEHHRAVEKKTGAHGSAAFPTPHDCLVGVSK